MELVELNKTNLEAWQIGRNDLAMFKEKLRGKREANEQDFLKDNKDLIEQIQKLGLDQDLEKSQFGEQAIKLFEETKNKKLIGGLGIRVGTSLSYDSEKAFLWAKEHSLCLQLNTREFEKIAKTQDISFVGKEEKITVTFPREIKL